LRMEGENEARKGNKFIYFTTAALVGKQVPASA
jgi:hypothetical protein